MIELLKRAFAKNAHRKVASGFKINSAFADKTLLSNAKLFVENPCVRRSVTVIANAVASMKFKVFRSGKYVSDHPLYDLLNRPNGVDSWSSFVEGLITNLMIYGNAYVVLMHNGKALELHNLQSKYMTIVPGDCGVPKAFEYYVDGRKIVFDNQDDLPNVGHIKTVNPYDNWYGLSPLDSIKASANLHQAITAHNLALIKNGGRVAGVVVLKTGAQPLSDDDKKALSDNLVSNYQGAENAGKIAFVESADLEWKQMGVNPKDMDYVNAKTLAAREISEALGVPAILIGGIGIDGESSRANFKEIIARFHEGTVLPIAQKMFSFLNNWLVAKIDSSSIVQMDLDNFLPLHNKRFDFWDKVNAATFLSDKEKRILLGLENIESEAQTVRVNG